MNSLKKKIIIVIIIIVVIMYSLKKHSFEAKNLMKNWLLFCCLIGTTGFFLWCHQIDLTWPLKNFLQLKEVQDSTVVGFICKSLYGKHLTLQYSIQLIGDGKILAITLPPYRMMSLLHLMSC